MLLPLRGTDSAIFCQKTRGAKNVLPVGAASSERVLMEVVLGIPWFLLVSHTERSARQVHRRMQSHPHVRLYQQTSTYGAAPTDTVAPTHGAAP